MIGTLQEDGSSYNITGINITSIYPSPFVDKINIDISSQNAGQVQIRLLDNTGQLLVNKTDAINSGVNSISIFGLNNLAKGIYMIQLQSGENMITQKLMKQ